MNFDEFVKKHNLLQDKEGRYHIIDEETGEKKELYCSISCLSNILSINDNILRSKLSNLPAQSGKNYRGKPTKFYNLNEALKQSFVSEYSNLPIADENGWILKNGEKYGTLLVLTEKLGIAKATIKSRLKKTIPHITGVRKGKICEFYQYKAIISACAELTEPTLPLVNDKRIAIIDGAEYATISAIEKKLHISEATIRERIKLYKLPYKEIKAANYRIAKAYNIALTKSICSDLLTDLPIANKDGFVTIEEMEYGTINAIAKKLKITPHSIKSRLSKSKTKITSKKIFGIKKRPLTAYNLNQFLENYPELIADLPKTDSNGKIVIKGREYAKISVLAQMFKSTRTTVLKRFKKNRVEKIKIQGDNNRHIEAYNIQQAQGACKDISQNLPKTNSLGFVIIDNILYGTVDGIAKKLNITKTAVIKRTNQSQFIKVRFKKLIVNAYNFEKVKIACADILEKK